ncbi:MAG: hypothetical protein ACFCUH_03765 [Flavobacteriales bacterium]|jgi:hypothetical protein
MERIATAISYTFHPLWMPLITLAVVYYIDPFLGLHPKVFRLLLLILLINLIAPGLSILIMRSRNLVSNLDITNRTERFLPFVLFLFYYGLSYFWLRRHGDALFMPAIVYGVFSALLVSLAVATVVTVQTKISMHMLAIGSVCGVIAAVNKIHLLGHGDLLGFSVLIAGAVGWARITLGVHTHAQVYLGFVTGFLIHFFCLTAGWYL